MQAKQKVTLYLSPELHRRLKIRAAIDAEPMSELAERAIIFHLEHPEVVDQIESYGRTHRVYNCPECTIPVVIQEGEMVSVGTLPGVIEQVAAERSQLPKDKEDEELVLVSAKK